MGGGIGKNVNIQYSSMNFSPNFPSRTIHFWIDSQAWGVFFVWVVKKPFGTVNFFPFCYILMLVCSLVGKSLNDFHSLVIHYFLFSIV